MHTCFSQLSTAEQASQSGKSYRYTAMTCQKSWLVLAAVVVLEFFCTACCRFSGVCRNSGSNFLKSASTAALTALTFLSFSLVTLNVQAQSTDVQPPTIELEEIENGIAGEMQSFTATVSDDQQLVSVILYHRLAGDENYLSTEMLPVSGTTVYSASVVITTDDPRDIEYYIQAEDFGGNKALKGFAFDPLTRQISADVVAVASITQPPAASMSRNRKIMWGVLGVLALGLIVSQTSSGSGNSGGGGTPTTTETPIELEINEIQGLGFSF